jgi:hypothetical protein
MVPLHKQNNRVRHRIAARGSHLQGEGIYVPVIDGVVPDYGPEVLLPVNPDQTLR